MKFFSVTIQMKLLKCTVISFSVVCCAVQGGCGFGCAGERLKCDPSDKGCWTVHYFPVVLFTAASVSVDENLKLFVWIYLFFCHLFLDRAARWITFKRQSRSSTSVERSVKPSLRKLVCVRLSPKVSSRAHGVWGSIFTWLLFGVYSCLQFFSV